MPGRSPRRTGCAGTGSSGFSPRSKGRFAQGPTPPLPSPGASLVPLAWPRESEWIMGRGDAGSPQLGHRWGTRPRVPNPPMLTNERCQGLWEGDTGPARGSQAGGRGGGDDHSAIPRGPVSAARPAPQPATLGEGRRHRFHGDPSRPVHPRCGDDRPDARLAAGESQGAGLRPAHAVILHQPSGPAAYVLPASRAREGQASHASGDRRPAEGTVRP